MTKTLAPGLALAILASSALASGVANAQEQPPTDNAVPRGGAGAVITHPDPPDPSKAPPPDKPAAPPAGFTMPKALNYQPPVYPPEAQKAGLEGAGGPPWTSTRRATSPRPPSSEPAGNGFDEAALAAAQGAALRARAQGRRHPVRRAHQVPLLVHPHPCPAGAHRSWADGDRQAGSTPPSPGWSWSPAATCPSRAPRCPSPLAGSPRARISRAPSPSRSCPPASTRCWCAPPATSPSAWRRRSPPARRTEVKYRLKPASDGALEVASRAIAPRARSPSAPSRPRRSRASPAPTATRSSRSRACPAWRGRRRCSACSSCAARPRRTRRPSSTARRCRSSTTSAASPRSCPPRCSQKIDFFPGNFGTQYGRVQGGIVDVGLRDPEEARVSTASPRSTSSTRASWSRGPSPSSTAGRSSRRGAAATSTRGSAPVLQSTGAGVTEAPVYYDYQFMIAKKPTPVRRASASRSSAPTTPSRSSSPKPPPSQPELAGQLRLHTAFQRLQLRYDQRLRRGQPAQRGRRPSAGTSWTSASAPSSSTSTAGPSAAAPSTPPSSGAG